MFTDDKTLHCFTHLFHQSVEVELQSWTLPFKGFEVKLNEEADHNSKAPPWFFMHSEFIAQAAALEAFVRPLEMPPAE